MPSATVPLQISVICSCSKTVMSNSWMSSWSSTTNTSGEFFDVSFSIPASLQPRATGARHINLIGRKDERLKRQLLIIRQISAPISAWHRGDSRHGCGQTDRRQDDAFAAGAALSRGKRIDRNWDRLPRISVVDPKVHARERRHGGQRQARPIRAVHVIGEVAGESTAAVGGENGAFG